jgi:hypothetical protein
LLQADGYAGFDDLYEAKNGRPPTVVEQQRKDAYARTASCSAAAGGL